MPFVDKSKIRKGLFMVSDAPTPGWIPKHRAEAELAQRYPAFKDALAAAGPAPSAERLIELDNERTALKARMASIKANLEAYRKARKSS